MRYLLDTNACIQILNGTSSRLLKQLQSKSSQDLVLCSIVKAELLFGVYNSKQVEQNLEHLQVFFISFTSFISLPFTDECAQNYAKIRHQLSKQGQLIGPNDMFIAAIATWYRVTLITNNVKEFSRIPSLFIEDWQ